MPSQTNNLYRRILEGTPTNRPDKVRADRSRDSNDHLIARGDLRVQNFRPSKPEALSSRVLARLSLSSPEGEQHGTR